MRASRLSWVVLLVISAICFTQGNASSLRHGNESGRSSRHVQVDSVKRQKDETNEATNDNNKRLKHSPHDAEDTLRKRNDQRNLGAVDRLFTTPVAQWTLNEWLILFVFIWLVGYFLRRCPCIYDLLACYCCYELFCDPNPAGFSAF